MNITINNEWIAYRIIEELKALVAINYTDKKTFSMRNTIWQHMTEYHRMTIRELCNANSITLDIF